MSPFAGFRDFQDCVNQNRDKRNPDAYCGSIKHEVEDKAMRKTIDSASYLHQSVRRALTLVAKGHDPNRERVFPTEECPDGQHNHEKGMRCHGEGQDHQKFQKAHDPVKEEGKKKLTESEGTSAEGAQDDQAFAVAFGPDNYDKLTKTIIAAPYQQAYNATGTILKALENKQFNFPGNIEEHMKKAHAAIHGREMWDARYSDVCDLITQARKILHSIEKTAEVSQGGSGMLVVGKADPGQSEQKAARPRPGSGQAVPEGGWQKDPFAGQRTAAGAIDISRTQPMAKPRPGAGVKRARKAVQKAIKAVRGE